MVVNELKTEKPFKETGQEAPAGTEDKEEKTWLMLT